MDNQWLNRKETPLPTEECKIKVRLKEEEKEGIWRPYNPENYLPNHQPYKGYLGTFVTIEKWNEQASFGIGYNAWEQNDSEFLEYQLI